MKTIKINHDQKLYVIPSGNGFSCLGFDVCQYRIIKLAKELGQIVPNFEKGTIEHYEYLQGLINAAREKNVTTGWRSQSELNPNLIGLEGKRVEATVYGERIRFYVGKSTGFIPCHLEIKNSRSSGGCALPAEPDKVSNVVVIR